MMPVTVVIPSRGRERTIRKHTLALVPDALVCVDEREHDAYARAGVPAAQILTHPAYDSLGKIRNWILDHVPEGPLMMLDDDVKLVSSRTGWNSRIYTDPVDVRAIIENAAEGARGFGTPLFGFVQQPSPVFYKPFDPFQLDTWIGCTMGFVERSTRYDNWFSMCEDIDLCLQVLLANRCIFMDTRFYFAALRDTNTGGMTAFRGADLRRESLRMMREKWGRWVEVVSDTTTTDRVRVLVKRRQTLARE